MKNNNISFERTQSHRAMFGVLAILLAGAAVKQYVRLGPAAAKAQTPMPREPASPSAGIRTENALSKPADIEFATHIETVLRELRINGKNTPVKPLQRNPFRERSDGTLGDLSASGQIVREKASTLAAANQLTLRFIMQSSVAPSCLINNLLLREQQQVNGFTVEQIREKSVVVRQGVYRFELKLLE